MQETNPFTVHVATFQKEYEMHFIVCEDHQTEALWLQKKIKNWALKQSVPVEFTVYESAEQFWFAYEEDMEADAVILDIQMPGEDGITLARRLRERHNQIPILFVTGVNDYIAEGYDVQAVHYLLKPVREDKLEECLNRIWQMRPLEEPFVLLQTEGDAVRLLQKDIITVEVFAHQCVYTTCDASYTVSESLKEAKEKLQEEWFMYAHRSILVNLFHVKSITHAKVYLTGGREAVVSRRMYGELNQAFIRFYQERLGR